MKNITFVALLALAFISINLTISVTYAETKIKIFKVNNLSKTQKLRLRAYPSPKSRIKISLPYNAIDLTEAGKKKVLGKNTWIQVNWKNNLGWVNKRYLKKTGVLVRNRTVNKKQASSSSRNIVKRAKVINTPVTTAADKPQEYGGDRYDQPVMMTTTDVKTAYTPEKNLYSSKRMLKCKGSTPNLWTIKMNITDKKMLIKMPNRQAFTMPINYHEWASPNKMRVNLGGDKGRNMVDINLEKTNSCNDGQSQKAYPYEVNATINKSFFFGCCDVAK